MIECTHYLDPSDNSQHKVDDQMTEYIFFGPIR